MKKTPAQRARQEDPARIAIFRALYLGDFLCATPALMALRTRFPTSELTLIGLPWTEEILGRFGVVDRFEAFVGYPGIPEVPYLPLATERFLERMRARQFDLAIQLHGSGHSSNGFVNALGARASIGYRECERDDSRLTRSLPWREDESEVLRWLRLVDQLDAHGSDRVQFPLSEAELTRADALLAHLPSHRPRIGLHGGAKLPSRRWPVSRFAQLGNLLAPLTKAAFVLTGTEAERPLTSCLRDRLGAPVHDLTGCTDLGTLAAVIDRLDLLVTNDTGVSHIAASTSTPSVVLFGPTDPRRWAPLDAVRHHVIDGGADERLSASSMDAIQVEQVCAACLSQLGQANRERVYSPSVSVAADPIWSR